MNTYKCLTFCATLALITLMGCSKSNETLPDENKTQTYNITELSYDYSQGFQVDSVYHVLDTISYINRGNATQPEQKYSLYEGLTDSLSFQLQTPDGLPANIDIDEGIYLPSIVQNHDVFYTELDSIYIGSLTETFTLPYSRRDQTTIGFTPTPNTWYQLTADYYRVHFSLPVKARMTSVDNSALIELQGRVEGSFVTTMTNNDAHPLKGSYLSANDLADLP